MKRFGIILIGTVLASLGLLFLRKSEDPSLLSEGKAIFSKERERKLELAEELDALGESFEALNIVSGLLTQAPLSGKEEEKAVSIAIEAASKIGELPLLEILYERYPKLFVGKETPLLQVTSYYISQRKLREAEFLLEKRAPEELKLPGWRLLEADLYLAKGNTKEALALLKDPFSSREAEVDRLLRVSLLERFHSPQSSWRYLEEAISIAPNDPKVRMQRAFFLESVDKIDYAIKEYAALAEGSPPESPFEGVVAKEKLASLFFNRTLHDFALQKFPEFLAKNPSEEILEKALFFEKVVSPLSIHIDEESIPKGDMQGYLLLLSKIPENRFWDERAATEISIVPTPASAEWLRVLEKIRLGDEKGAYEVMRQASDSVFLFDPELYDRIWALLENASRKGLPIDRTEMIATLADQGWFEAALLLGGEKGDFRPSPRLNLLIAKALENNRGLQESIKFLGKAATSSEEKLELVTLLRKNNQEDEAIVLLEPLLQSHGAIKEEAAYLLATLLMEKNELQKAYQLVAESARLQNDIVLQERIAKEALLANNEAFARVVYQKIEERSDVATAYFAKEAYQKRDFETAFRLTKKLLERNPSSKTLRENVKKIEAELKRTHG